MEGQQSNRQSLQIDLVTPKSFRQTQYHNFGGLFLRISLLCLSTAYFGYTLAHISTIKQPVLARYFGNDVKDSIVYGLLLGCFAIGAALGAIISPILLVFFTRRNCILFINFWAFIIGGIIQYNNLIVLFVMRTLQGLCIGGFMAIVPIYIKELCPKQLLGSLGVLTQFYVVTAIVCCYALGLILNSTNVDGQVMWRVMFVVTQGTILIQTFLFLIGFIPESPNSLIAKGKKQQAKRVLGLFHKQDYIEEVFKERQLDVIIEFKDQQESQTEKERRQTTYMGMDIKKHQDQKKKNLNVSWKAYLLGFQLPLMQQLTGINAIVTQVGGLVSTFSSTAGTYTPVVIIFIQLVATALAIPLLKYQGRRFNTLLGNLLLGIIDIILGILFLFVGYKPVIYIILVFLVLYMIVYGISLGPVVWLYVPEIIPPKVVPVATSMNWLGCAVCIICLPIVTNKMNGNPYGAFFFFGGWTLISFVINLILMVETKGLTTQQVIKKFHGQL